MEEKKTAQAPRDNLKKCRFGVRNTLL